MRFKALSTKEVRVNGHHFVANGCRCHVVCMKCNKACRRDEAEQTNVCPEAKKAARF